MLAERGDTADDQEDSKPSLGFDRGALPFDTQAVVLFLHLMFL